MNYPVINEIAEVILKNKKGFPLRVGIDGIDAAGKTFLANKIAEHVRELGYPTLRASIDGFHNPRSVRHHRGSYSPEGYYFDSFNYELLKQSLLEPLSPTGNRICNLSAFNFKTDTETIGEEIKATDDHILIFEGVFLFRRELVAYWDIKVFIHIDFETSLARALKRDLYLFGNEAEIRKRYQERYIPGQKIYLEAEKPLAKADIVLENNDFLSPIVTRSQNTPRGL